MVKDDAFIYLQILPTSSGLCNFEMDQPLSLRAWNISSKHCISRPKRWSFHIPNKTSIRFLLNLTHFRASGNLMKSACPLFMWQRCHHGVFVCFIFKNHSTHLKHGSLFFLHMGLYYINLCNNCIDFLKYITTCMLYKSNVYNHKILLSLLAEAAPKSK